MRDIWIFQLGHALDGAQQQEIKQKLNLYLDEWKAHGAPVPGSAELLYDQFVIVRAQPGSTSGCSIDDMTRNVSAIIAQAGGQIMENNYVFYKTGAQPVAFLDFREAEAALADGRLQESSHIFNAAIQSAAEFDQFELPLSHSWLNRFLPKKA